MTGARGIGMVVVVPRLAARDGRKPRHIRAAIARGERTLAPHVADRVDRPRHVVHERHPHEGHPEEGLKRTGPAVDGVADRGRHHHADDRDNRPKLRDAVDGPVGDEVGCVLAGIGARVGEEPADVGVDEAAGQPAGAGAVLPRRVRIAVCVRELMMLAMVRDPVDDSAFDGEAAGKGEEGSHLRASAEGIVGEEAVVPDGDAVHSDGIDHDEHRDVKDAHPAVDERNGQGHDDGRERHHDEEAEDGPVERARRVGCKGIGGGFGQERRAGLIANDGGLPRT